ncbi:hypothetical protein Sez_1001 [Streptococcus equi subsp. zooepidemicus MGCS10565]|uniref:Uncharacterized protein n=1 Tax=Streptococcus equi subsp. zooepidemicus (strain MGCS10565) TaxID=552526 RepID=B4U2Y8_STREM|nr:hypothetical protein Sez_1001 [Streptococcus equi subsp. zooepidemicus MGCS10565]
MLFDNGTGVIYRFSYNFSVSGIMENSFPTVPSVFLIFLAIDASPK